MSLTWTRLVANWDPATTCPSEHNSFGFSAIVSIYSHQEWTDSSHKSFDYNRFENYIQVPGYPCFYMGYSRDIGAPPTKMVFTNNTIFGCQNSGNVVGWARGATNIWSGNTIDNGTPIPEPSNSGY
jgi:hypothetical protein